MKNKLFQAAISHQEAKRDEALAVLEVYFKNPVGIGEHSDLLNEINKWAAQLAEAEETLETLKEYFQVKKDGCFCIGQSVFCNVWELLSPFDSEGVILAIQDDYCIVRFYSKTIKLHKTGLTPR